MSIELPYIVMAGLRGPDQNHLEGSLAWKHFVTEPLRYLAARALGEDPASWCLGGWRTSVSTRDLTNGLSFLRLEDLEDAKLFAGREDTAHVRIHAYLAYAELQKALDGYDYVLGQEVEEHRVWLVQHGLIRVQCEDY